jgi:DNA polymerase-3 subunit delta
MYHFTLNPVFMYTHADAIIITPVVYTKTSNASAFGQVQEPDLFYIMYGEDDFSLGEALSELKQGLGDQSAVSTNTTVLQAQSITPEELISTCSTIPFLAPFRLVIVEGLLGLFEQQVKTKRTTKLKGAGWASLKEFIGQMPETTILVLVDGKIKTSNRLLKELTPLAKVREFRQLGTDDLLVWIRTRAKKSKGDISPAAARLLTSLVGSNLHLLSNEIDKLCLYALDRTIEKDDVTLLVSNAREPNVFAMVDAILNLKPDTAAKLLHQLEDEGDAPPYLLFMITRQFRLVIQAKDLLQQKRKPSEFGAILGIYKDFMLRKTIEQARTHSPKRLKHIYQQLLDTDIAIKTGRFKGDKGELALDLLIIELCA